MIYANEGTTAAPPGLHDGGDGVEVVDDAAGTTAAPPDLHDGGDGVEVVDDAAGTTAAPSWLLGGGDGVEVVDDAAGTTAAPSWLLGGGDGVEVVDYGSRDDQQTQGGGENSFIYYVCAGAYIIYKNRVGTGRGAVATYKRRKMQRFSPIL